MRICCCSPKLMMSNKYALTFRAAMHQWYDRCVIQPTGRRLFGFVVSLTSVCLSLRVNTVLKPDLCSSVGVCESYLVMSKFMSCRTPTCCRHVEDVILPVGLPVVVQYRMYRCHMVPLPEPSLYHSVHTKVMHG
jgi:hypothetical protein